MKNMSPEKLVARFIKSATNGRVIKPRWRRILTLVLIPIWVTGLWWSCYGVYDGIAAMQRVKELEIEERQASQIVARNQYGERVYPYQQVTRVQNEKFEVKQRQGGLFYPLIFLVVCFIVPWVVTRLIYWVKDADKVKETVSS